MITRALAEIRETVAREKRRRGELGFDDMLSRLDSALRSESGEVLAAAIRTRFPVAMIDEFQDTDPSSTEFSPYLAPSAGNRIVADWRPEAGHICIPGCGYLHLYEGA